MSLMNLFSSTFAILKTISTIFLDKCILALVKEKEWKQYPSSLICVPYTLNRAI